MTKEELINALKNDYTTRNNLMRINLSVPDELENEIAQLEYEYINEHVLPVLMKCGSLLRPIRRSISVNINKDKINQFTYKVKGLRNPNLELTNVTTSTEYSEDEFIIKKESKWLDLCKYPSVSVLPELRDDQKDFPLSDRVSIMIHQILNAFKYSSKDTDRRKGDYMDDSFINNWSDSKIAHEHNVTRATVGIALNDIRASIMKGSKAEVVKNLCCASDEIVKELEDFRERVVFQPEGASEETRFLCNEKSKKAKILLNLLNLRISDKKKAPYKFLSESVILPYGDCLPFQRLLIALFGNYGVFRIEERRNDEERRIDVRPLTFDKIKERVKDKCGDDIIKYLIILLNNSSDIEHDYSDLYDKFLRNLLDNISDIEHGYIDPYDKAEEKYWIKYDRLFSNTQKIARIIFERGSILTEELNNANKEKTHSDSEKEEFERYIIGLGTFGWISGTSKGYAYIYDPNHKMTDLKNDVSGYFKKKEEQGLFHTKYTKDTESKDEFIESFSKSHKYTEYFPDKDIFEKIFRDALSFLYTLKTNPNIEPKGMAAYIKKINEKNRSVRNS